MTKETVLTQLNINSHNKLIEYVDANSDGGFWFINNVDDMAFVDITPKALELFGYESLQELKDNNISPSAVIGPTANSPTFVKDYGDFLEDRRAFLLVDVIIARRDGEQIYGELRLTKSVTQIDEINQLIYKGEINLIRTSAAIFRESRELLDQVDQGISIFKLEENGDYTLVYVNSGISKILGYNAENKSKIEGSKLEVFIYPEDYDKVQNVFKTAVENKRALSETYRLLSKSGEVIWVKAEHSGVKLGNADYVYVTVMNITEMLTMQEEMTARNERLSQFVNNTPVGLVVFDIVEDDFIINAVNDTMVRYVNSSKNFVKNMGHAVYKEELQGCSYKNLLCMVDELDVATVSKVLKSCSINKVSECTYKIDNAVSGETKESWIHARVKRRGDVAGLNQAIAVFSDITKLIEYEHELKANQDRLILMSYHDGLTGVMNRKSYNEVVRQSRGRNWNRTGIIFFNINGLKIINDTFGHTHGDEAIQEAASYAEKYFEQEDIYRISGDDFVIIKENIAKDAFDWKVRELSSSLQMDELASVGSIWRDQIDHIDVAVDMAEELMRVAKQEYYTLHKDDESRHRPRLLNSLLDDLEQGKYVMYLQPKAYTTGTEVVEAEALIRRLDNEGRVVSPLAFVPKLEREKLISHLDLFMLEEVCKLLQRWNSYGDRRFKVSVNMSRVTLAEADYLDKLLSITGKYDIDNSQIELEVTESNQTMDEQQLPQMIERISSLGFGVSLDDMGTDYSSIRLLPLVGVDTVKIDRSFILMLNTKEGKILVDHLIKMCHELNQKTIAEGVEDNETREILYQMGCDMYQGYLLSKPLPVKEFEKLLLTSD